MRWFRRIAPALALIILAGCAAGFSDFPERPPRAAEGNDTTYFTFYMGYGGAEFARPDEPLEDRLNLLRTAPLDWLAILCEDIPVISVHQESLGFHELIPSLQHYQFTAFVECRIGSRGIVSEEEFPDAVIERTKEMTGFMEERFPRLRGSDRFFMEISKQGFKYRVDLNGGSVLWTYEEFPESMFFTITNDYH